MTGGIAICSCSLRFADKSGTYSQVFHSRLLANAALRFSNRCYSQLFLFTELGAPYSSGNVNYFLPDKRCLRAEALHPPRGIARSGFRPLSNILGCSPP